MCVIQVVVAGGAAQQHILLKAVSYILLLSYMMSSSWTSLNHNPNNKQLTDLTDGPEPDTFVIV